QISEFSLIVAALGVSIGHITQETMGLITLVGVVTIFLSTYMILYSGQLYNLFSRPLKIFERRNPYREAAIDTLDHTFAVDVILVGLGNNGSALAEHLLRQQKTILGVDFAPDVLTKWNNRGVKVLYGDIADPELLGHLPLSKTRWVVSTVRSRELNLALVRHLRHDGFEGGVALTALNEEEADAFVAAGADIVFRPFVDAAEQAADALTQAMDFLPDHVHWPINFLETRIRPGSLAVGRTIRELPLRTET
ncbi:MAG: NAD-binding protein, partial [Caldilinea sp.]